MNEEVVKMVCDACGCTATPNVLEFQKTKITVQCPNPKCGHVGVIPRPEYTISSHHLIPRSRGGNGKSSTRNNTRSIHGYAHNAWHVLFGNATPSEAILLIRKYWTSPETDDKIPISKNCQHYYIPPE